MACAESEGEAGRISEAVDPCDRLCRHFPTLAGHRLCARPSARHSHTNFLFVCLILFYFLTLQYCTGFAIYQNESTTGIQKYIFKALCIWGKSQLFEMCLTAVQGCYRGVGLRMNESHSVKDE